jgi:divalent metal cation (Fe/Co/Zn/Cd) transporter
VQRGLPIEVADRIADEVRQKVHQATGCRYCIIHVDPKKTEDAVPKQQAANPQDPST